MHDLLNPQQCERAQARQGKNARKYRNLWGINEDLESVFNAVLPSAAALLRV
jgi:hypothetical protein